MKIKKIKVYDYTELSKQAQERAYKDWKADVEHDFLGENMQEKLDDLLKKYKIKSGNAKTYFSLSYSQGDGAMFEGTLEWGTWKVVIKQSGRYYHSNSKDIEMYQVDDENIYPEQHTLDKFEAIYQKICKELEAWGYKCIEDEESLETFRYACQEYNYTFTEEGKMENL